MINFFLGEFLTYLPRFFYVLVWIGALILFIRPAAAGARDEISELALRKKYFWLVVAVIGFKIIYAVLLSWGQYYVWAADPLKRIFITAPIASDVPLFGLFKVLNFLKTFHGGYFIYFVIGRYWLSAFISVFASSLFYGFWKLISIYRAGLLYKYEPNLLFLMALLSGWPGFVLFFCLTIIASLGLLIFLFFRNQNQISISRIIFFAALISILFAAEIINRIGLLVLKI